MAVTGMVFQLDPATGKPVPTNWQDGGAISETPFPGDWQLVVTGVPGGTSAATVASMIVGAPLALPLPWKSMHWQIPYSSLSGACTATAW